MGVYDEVVIGDKTGQVKLWKRDLTVFKLGDIVPPVNGLRDYDIAMREGGYVQVRDLRITGWADTADGSADVFDKWGSRWVGASSNIGEVGQVLAAWSEGTGYFFEKNA